MKKNNKKDTSQKKKAQAPKIDPLVESDDSENEDVLNF